MSEYLKIGSKKKLWSLSSYKRLPNKILARHLFAKKNNSSQQLEKKNNFAPRSNFLTDLFDAVSEMHQNNSMHFRSRTNTFLLRLSCTVVSTVRSKSRASSSNPVH